MLTVLSLFDERSRPKGSRDPLGIESIWSHLGRQVIGNLTTITSNLDNFIVALLCCHYGNQCGKELHNIQDGYLRAEQLMAYLRLTIGRGSILGITRAKSNLDSANLPLGMSESAQILSNQLSYGLWGLYSTAMQSAGLISRRAERTPTDIGKELIQKLISQLGEVWWAKFTLIASSKQASLDDIRQLAPAIEVILKNPALKKAMVNGLLDWKNKDSLQSELFAQANIYLADSENGSLDACRFCNWILSQTNVSKPLKRAIKQIHSVEPLLVLSATVMNWLLGQRDRTPDELVAALMKSFGANKLYFTDEWREVTQLPNQRFLNNLFLAANDSQAKNLIESLIEQNKFIMSLRGGAPWLEWEGNRLKVRMPNDRSNLPENLTEACHLWSNSYFIDSFLCIAKEGQ
jgi:hypothetical protein